MSAIVGDPRALVRLNFVGTFNGESELRESEKSGEIGGVKGSKDRNEDPPGSKHYSSRV